METSSFYTRNMLLQYHKQLVASRTIAHHKRIMDMVTGEEPDVSAEAKRRIMVNRVAREVFTNLLVTGSENPMVSQVQEALRQEFGEGLTFHYPANSLELMILRETPDGYKEVAKHEHADITSRAWGITLNVVDSYVV